MTKDETLRMALEALEAMQMYAEAERKGLRICDETITAIKEALAQPEREILGNVDYIPCCTDQTCPKCKPPQSEPEPVACISALTDQCAVLIWERDELQKQVWRYEKNGVTCQTYGHKIDSSCSECNVHENYTAAPKRTWVGLTDEEIGKLYRDGWSNNMEFARAIEAKLKQKNGYAKEKNT